MDSLRFPRLSELEYATLEATITLLETEAAISSFLPQKAPERLPDRVVSDLYETGNSHTMYAFCIQSGPSGSPSLHVGGHVVLVPKTPMSAPGVDRLHFKC